MVETAERPGRFRFAHALIREALYEALDPSARPQLHRDVGRAIERPYEAEPGPHVAILAHHFCRAALAGDPERGVGYAARAAERAIALLAYVDRFQLREGKLEDFKRYATEMAELVENNEPGVISFNYYLDEDGAGEAAVFVFSDAEALDVHLDLDAGREPVGALGRRPQRASRARLRDARIQAATGRSP
jgi:quinol monooxygenase YgiN